MDVFFVWMCCDVLMCSLCGCDVLCVDVFFVWIVLCVDVFFV